MRITPDTPDFKATIISILLPKHIPMKGKSIPVADAYSFLKSPSKFPKIIPNINGSRLAIIVFKSIPCPFAELKIISGIAGTTIRFKKPKAAPSISSP